MERRSKQQKYVQMVIANNQDPVSLKLNKDNVLEISFLPKNKHFDFQQDQIWIPPPAKTSRRLAGSQKYPKNNIFINIPADGAIEKTNDKTLRIALGKNEKSIQEKHINSPSKEDDKILELQEQTQRVRGTFHAQEHVLEEAEDLLKEHENKQKVLSKYCRILKKNMQDIAKSIKELDNQNKVLKKTKSTEKTKMLSNSVNKEHRVSSCSKHEIVHEEVGIANISQDENTDDLLEEYSPSRKRNDFDKRSRKQKLKRTCSIENVSIMYLPVNKSVRQESEEESNKTVKIKDKTSKQITSQQCIPTENLMMKLSDNMRKTKLLVDSVYQEDETVDTMQRKYVSEVEKLYREQQELLDKIYQTLDNTNSDITTRSSETFPKDNVQNQYANSTERSSVQEETKAMQREERMSKSFPDIHLQKETKSLEDRLEHADKKLIKLKKELEDTKIFQSKYKPEIDEQEYLTIHKNLENKAINKLSAPMKFFKKDGIEGTPKETGFNNSLKNDDYACQTEITQVVRQLPSNISGKFNITNDPKTESASKNDSYISETKITQKLRFLPLKSIEETIKSSSASPITEILKDINKSIDNVMPFCKYILPGAEYLNTEEGSLTTDDISYKEVPQKEYYDRDSSKTDDESTKILKRADKDKIQKHQAEMESNKHKENGRMKYYFDPEGHSLVNDNTKYKDVAQKSYNQNGISKLQDKTRKESEHSDKTRQKYQMQKDNNQYIENRRETDFNRKPTESNGYGSSQRFTQLSTMEECDCSGECTNPRHFNEFSDFQNPSQMKDKSKQKTIHSTLTNETPLEGSIGIDDDTTDSKSDYQIKKSDPPDKGNKTKEEDKKNFFIYQTPLVESTKIDGGTSDFKNDYQDQKSDSSGAKNNTIQENKLKFYSNQAPLAESTKTYDNTLDSENDYQNKKSNSPEVKNKTKYNFFADQTPLAESTRLHDDSFNSETDYDSKKYYPSRADNKNRQENKYEFFRNQKPIAESNRMDYKSNNDKGFKSQYNKASQTDYPVFTSNNSIYQPNFQSELYSQRNWIATDINGKKFDHRIHSKNNSDKHKWNDQPIYRRHMQTTLNEFVYTYPKMPKEKFPDSVFASTPKKIPPSVNRGAKDVPITTEKDTTAISDIEKASNKINTLYKDIMSQF